MLHIGLPFLALTPSLFLASVAAVSFLLLSSSVRCQAHGFLMWISFGVLMPGGILVARFLQPVGPFWFHLHYILQTLAVLCAVCGFAVAVNGFQALTDTTHAQLGIAVFIITGLQPLIALVRPHKGNAWRVVFYATHWTLGMSAVGLGWYNIYTGIGLYGEDWATDVLVSIGRLDSQ